MASPMSPDKLMAVLKAEGLTVKGVRSWRSHRRPSSTGGFAPNGVMLHHTVTKGTDSSVSICYNGHATLPGPLCHGVIDKDGTVYLVSAGRSNHAGSGDDDVLRAVINETEHPVDNEANTDGNARFYGFECVNLGNGSDPWPAVQVDAMVRASAAICRHYGWNENSVIAHKEWQPGKIDPRGKDFDNMDSFRDRIGKRLKGSAGGGSAPKPPADKPKPPADDAPSVDLSKLVTAARKNPPAKGTPVTYSGVKTVEKALVKAGYLSASLADGHYGTATKSAYAAWQRKCGYSGSDADGIPGSASLKKLGAKYGFKVVA